MKHRFAACESRIDVFPMFASEGELFCIISQSDGKYFHIVTAPKEAEAVWLSRAAWPILKAKLQVISCTGPKCLVRMNRYMIETADVIELYHRDGVVEARSDEISDKGVIMRLSRSMSRGESSRSRYVPCSIAAIYRQ